MGRTGFRPWTLKGHSSAQKQELEVNYDTGEVALSDENRALVSPNISTRMRCHMDSFRQVSLDYNIYSDVSYIDIDKRLPLLIENGEEILTNPITLPAYKKFIISFDIDTLTNISDITYLLPDDAINIELTFLKNGTERVTITKRINELNSSALVPTSELTSLQLVSFKVNIDSVAYDVYKIILYGILITGR